MTEKIVESYYVWYKVIGDSNHSDSKPACVQVEIKKEPITPGTPVANKLTYNGKEQELVTAGKAKNGTLVYAIGKDEKTAPKDADFKEAIPKGKDAGTYFMWFKTVGNAGSGESEPGVVKVNIVPKTVRLEWTNTSFTYDGEKRFPTAIAKSLIKGDKCSVKVKGAAKKVGTHTATAKSLSNSNYTLPKERTVTFTITKKEEPKEPKETTPKGESFRGLKLVGETKGNNILLKWTKYPGAVKYVVYGSKCGKKYEPKKLKTLSGTKYLLKVKRPFIYKCYVKAYDASGKELSRARTVHVTSKGYKYGNPKGVKVNKGSVKVKVGKKAKVKGEMVSDMAIDEHREIRYESSNPRIAKVNAKTGEITGVKKGDCYVYVYAQNGVYKRVTVNVR